MELGTDTLGTYTLGIETLLIELAQEHGSDRLLTGRGDTMPESESPGVSTSQPDAA